MSIELLIMFGVVIGSSITSYNIGVRSGAEGMFEFLWTRGEKVVDDAGVGVNITLRKET